jgi:hypothetical protein
LASTRAQRALELTNVRTNALREEERDFLRQGLAFRRRFAHQDRHARLELGLLDGDRQPPTETRLQALLEARDFLWITVAGQDNLPLTFE